MSTDTTLAPPSAPEPDDVVRYDSGMDSTRRTRRTLVLAALALVLVLAVITVVLGQRSDLAPTAQPAPVPPATAPTTAPSTTASASTTAQVPVEATALTAAPEGVTWELFQGIALPVSTTDGPTRVDGDVHAGFAQTPTGALLADAQISARSIATPSLSSLRLIAEQQLFDGPGRASYLNLLATLDENDAPAEGYTQYVAFRYITYSPDLAVISLAARGQSGTIQVATSTLRWADGDWKLDLPASGLQQPQVVTDLSGYIPWKGIS